MDQLWELRKLLEAMEELLRSENTQGTSRLTAVINLLSKPDGIKRYQYELRNLEAKLRTNPGRTDQALFWPFEEGEVKETLEYLEHFQQLLNSAINLDHT